MLNKVVISECKCGESGTIYIDGDEFSHNYHIGCSCGQKTFNYKHIEDAITEWNEMNKPKKLKVKYTCRNCGAEVYPGFKECTKCGVEIEW